MSYRVSVDYCPAYELVGSYCVFTNWKSYYQLGPQWRADIIKQVGEDFLDQLKAMPADIDMLNVLIAHCPGERDVRHFLQWFQELPAGTIYELVSAHILDDIPNNLGEFRDLYCRYLADWNERYFVGMDPHILTDLEKEAAHLRSIIADKPPAEIVERCSNVVILEHEGLEEIILVPSYHIKPISGITCLKHSLIFSYSHSTHAADYELSAKITAIAHALSDEKRLLIIKKLTQRELTFNELAKQLKLSKSNLHYHLSILRAVGYIQKKVNPYTRVELYATRPELFDPLPGMLSLYLNS